jgi:hypothetical protein
LKFIRIFENSRTVTGRFRPTASTCWPSPAAEAAREPVRRGAWSSCDGRARGDAVAQPTWLAGGLPNDEVFTSSTVALRGGSQARWGDNILTTVARGGGGGFSGGVPAIGNSSGGESGGEAWSKAHPGCVEVVPSGDGAKRRGVGRGLWQLGFGAYGRLL